MLAKKVKSELSNYQINVIEHLKNNRHLIVEARAGSGKTSTIVEAIKSLPEYNRILCVAFNKKIAEELKNRLPQHVQTNTINSLLPTDVSLSFACGTDVSFGTSQFTFKPNITKKSLTISFAVDVSGNTNKYNVKSHLGWLLGFRKPSYTFSSTYPINVVSSIVSEGILDLSGKKYLFLALDEFSNASHSSSFLSYLSRSVVNRNIIARLDIDTRVPFGSYETANLMNGMLVSDLRTYSNERVDLQKCNIQLVNEYGQPISLNNMDFSLCLELTHS